MIFSDSVRGRFVELMINDLEDQKKRHRVQSAKTKSQKRYYPSLMTYRK